MREHCPTRAAKDYLRVLELAAKESEAGVDAVLGRLLEWNVPITPTVVAEHLRPDLGLPRAMEVVVTMVDRSTYDLLLETREDFPLANHQTCMGPGRIVSGSSTCRRSDAITNRRRSGPVKSH